jgi:hypothetical protein
MDGFTSSVWCGTLALTDGNCKTDSDDAMLQGRTARRSPHGAVSAFTRVFRRAMAECVAASWISLALHPGYTLRPRHYALWGGRVRIRPRCVDRKPATWSAA